MKKVFIKIWPLLCILGVWFIFSSPYFLKGLVPFSSKYLVTFFAPWNTSYGMPVKNNAMPDVITQLYPWKQLAIESWKQGQVPRWNPYQFAGSPLLANVQSAVFSPFNLLFFLLPFIDAWSLLILLQPLLAGIFMYRYVREIRVAQVGAFVSAIAFMFCGFITVWMAYGTLGYAISYLPLLLFSAERYRNTGKMRYGMLIALSGALSIFSGHFQTSVYLLLTGFAYTVFLVLEAKKRKNTLPIFLFILLAGICSLPQLGPSIRLYLQSVRSGLHQVMETIPWSYLPTLIAPDILGNPVTRNDWFGHYAEWASYIGVFPLMLAFASVALDLRNKYVRFYSVLGLLAILTAYQTPIGTLLVSSKIPVLSTSALSRTIVLFSFAASVLAGIGFEGVQLAWEKKQKHCMITLVLVFGAFFALLWFSILSGNILFLRALSAEKLLVAKRNLLLPSGLFMLCSLYMLSGFVVRAGWRKVLTVFAILIVVLDMLRFCGKWMPFDPRSLVYPEIPVLSYLTKQSGNWRVFGNLGNEALGAFRIFGVEGYDPLFITRYGELVTASSKGSVGALARSTVLFDKQGAYTKRLMDMMGVRYFFHSKGDGRNIWAFPFWEYPDSFGSSVYSDDSYEIYENVHALPRAYIAESYMVAASDVDLIGRLLDPSTNLRHTVILEEDPGIAKRSNTNELLSKEDNAILERYTPNEVIITTDAEQEGLLFLSDAYYPGWSAYVNGQKSKIYRADYAFRAVVVPEGRSSVRFVYENWFL